MPSLPPAIELIVHRAGDGPPLVALHDLGQTGESMIDALGELAGTYRIIAPDLRGHGASPTPHGPWSIDDFASDVARLTAAEGGGAILVGVGLGAAAGLALALGHPGLLAGCSPSSRRGRADALTTRGPAPCQRGPAGGTEVRTPRARTAGAGPPARCASSAAPRAWRSPPRPWAPAPTCAARSPRWTSR